MDGKVNFKSLEEYAPNNVIRNESSHLKEIKARLNNYILIEGPSTVQLIKRMIVLPDRN